VVIVPQEEDWPARARPLSVELYEDGLILRWLRTEASTSSEGQPLYELFAVRDDSGTEYQLLAGSECFGRGESHFRPAAPEGAHVLAITSGSLAINLQL